MDAVILLSVMGVILGFVIGVAAKIFAVQTDPRLEQIEELLPGANCGACGFAGCADFARALAAGQASPEVCPSSSTEAIERIATLMGVSVGERVRQVAVVRCGGDNLLATWSAHYNGVADCRSANAVAGGVKGCSYGCLGLGTCSAVCPFDAIEITPNGMAIVHPDLCTGCGKCVAACPRGLIVMVPKSAPLHNLCNNPDKGAATRKVCTVSCIGCRKCVKEAGEGQMTMDGFLARVNYEDPPAATVAAVCPTKSLQPSLLVADTMPARHHKDEAINA